MRVVAAVTLAGAILVSCWLFVNTGRSEPKPKAVAATPAPRIRRVMGRIQIPRTPADFDPRVLDEPIEVVRVPAGEVLSPRAPSSSVSTAPPHRTTVAFAQRPREDDERYRTRQFVVKVFTDWVAQAQLTPEQFEATCRIYGDAILDLRVAQDTMSDLLIEGVEVAEAHQVELDAERDALEHVRGRMRLVLTEEQYRSYLNLYLPSLSFSSVFDVELL